jgi:ABC-2 type transport system permease protein
MIEARAARPKRSAAETLIPAWVAACLASARLGCRETWRQKAALVGAFLTYALIVAVWASLWRLVPDATLARLSLDYEQVVWYFAVTEVIAFSLGHCYRQIEHEIQTGGTAAFLVRPVGYVALISAQELGHMAARIALLGVPGSALAWALTGTVPFGPALLLPLALLLIGGGAVYLILQVMIGLTTAWLGTARPQFFIIQKCVFVLGGLIVPLSAYPDALQRVVWLTPFPATLYAPASLALGVDAAHVGRMLALQAFWLALGAAGLAALSHAFERRLTTAGEG